MTKKDGLKKTSAILGIIISSSVIATGFGGLCYKAYGKELIRPDVEEIIKPFVLKIQVVEKENDTLKKNLEKLIKKQDFTNDVLYNMNPQAYLKTKKERQDKEN